MLLRLEPHILILLLPALIFSLCVHEFSHGYIAYKLGDNTAHNKGRLTLNPLSHLDPMGSLMILFTLSPAIFPASLVACLCESLKYAGTVITASVTEVPR